MHNFRGSWIFLLSLLIAINADAASKQLWESRIQTNVSNIGYQIPEVMNRDCYDGNPAENPEKAMHQKDGCTYSNIKHSGNKTTWNARCVDDNGTMEGTGEAVASGGKFTSTQRMHGKAKSEPYEMTINITGRKISDSCSQQDVRHGSQSTQATRQSMDQFMQGMMSRQSQMMEKYDREMQASEAEQCDTANKEATELVDMTRQYFGANASCPGREQEVCNRLRDEINTNKQLFERIDTVDSRQSKGHIYLSRECHLDMDRAKASFCKASASEDELDSSFLEKYCPTEYAAWKAAQEAESGRFGGAGNVLDKAGKLKGMFGF